MQWFGEKPFGPACEADAHVAVPIGRCCSWCMDPFVAGDKGVLVPSWTASMGDSAFHRECFLRQIFGSVAHQCRQCSCYGGTGEDAPGLTRREAATAAYTEFVSRLQPGSTHAD